MRWPRRDGISALAQHRGPSAPRVLPFVPVLKPGVVWVVVPRASAVVPMRTQCGGCGRDAFTAKRRASTHRHMHMNSLLRVGVSLSCALWVTTALQAQAGPATPPAALDSLIAAQMSEVGIMGLGAAVIVDRKVVWMKGYGFTDYARAKPFTQNTIMGVASIAKPFLGVAMMRAVHEGKLSLDEDINRYLPFRVVNPYFPNERITLRQLATHSSSITDRWEVYSATYHFGGDSPDTLGVFLEKYFTPGRALYSPGNFLRSKPGTQRDYCNICAALAGLIVERAFGEPLNVYTRKHILAPLGMSRTGWFMSEVDMANHTTHFVAHNGHTVPIPHYGATTYPDGGVRTSVSDLSQFFVAMLNGGAAQGVRILDAGMATEMMRFQFNDTNRPENFPAADGNSGLFWRTKFNGTRVGHGGNDPGISAEMLADLDRRNGVILLMNTSLSGADNRAASVILDALWRFAAAGQAPTR